MDLCLFYIHIISLSSILDRPSRFLYRSHYCFKQDTVSQSNYYALVQLFFFDMLWSCRAVLVEPLILSFYSWNLFWILIFIFYCFHLLLERNCYILTLRFQIEDCLLSVHESQSFKCSWIPWLCILQTPVFYFVT